MDTEFQRRYARHIMLEGIGEQGQQKIAKASVLVIGAGGLGSAALTYLASAGVGTLGIIDHDHVELSNLQRQIMHEEGDIGRLKVESARDRISELNSACNVICYAENISTHNAKEIASHYDIVLDGSDNFTTRFVIQEACYHIKKPLVSGAIQQFHGQLALFTPYLGDTHPCYRCFVPERPPSANNCTQTGVIGPLCGVVGAMQALEALKWIIYAQSNLSGKVMRYDALKAEWKESILAKNPDCPICAR